MGRLSEWKRGGKKKNIMLFVVHGENSALLFTVYFGGVRMYLTSTSAARIVWLIALVEIPSEHRTGRCWQTGRTREQTDLLFTTGQRSLTGPDSS